MKQSTKINRNTRRSRSHLFILFIALMALGAVGLLGGLATAQSTTLLTLDEAIKLATNGSPAVIEAQDAAWEAELELDRAQGAFRTTVSLGGGLVMNDKGSDTSATAQASGSLGSAISWSARTSTTVDSGGSTDSVSVSYQLWPPPADSSSSIALENAQRRLEAAQYELDIARATATLSALDLYYKVQLAGERLRLAEELLADAEKTLARIEERVALGRASTADRITAEIELLERQSELAARQSQLNNAKAELARLIGKSVDEIELPPLEDGLLDGMDVSMDVPGEVEAIEAALKASTGLRARELAVSNARRSLEIAMRNHGLGVSLNGGLDVRPSGTTDWSVRLSGNYAFIDGGTRRRNVQSAQHALEKAERAYASTVESIEEQVRGSLRALENGSRTVEIRRNMESLRHLNLTVAEQQAAIGYITDAELRERHRASRMAMLDRIEAEVSLHLERRRLDILMGKLQQQ